MTDLSRRFNEAIQYETINFQTTFNCGLYILHGTSYLAKHPELLEEACRRTPAALIVVFNTYDLQVPEQKQLFDSLRENPKIGYTQCVRNLNNTLHVFTFPVKDLP